VLGLGALGVEGQHARKAVVGGLGRDRVEEGLAGLDVDRAGEPETPGTRRWVVMGEF